jgi:hypothetical protein
MMRHWWDRMAVAIGVAGAVTIGSLVVLAGTAQAQTATCDKTAIARGSGNSGGATCQLSGFAPNETIGATSSLPNFNFTPFNVGPNGTGENFTFSDCTDQPGPFTITLTGQTSHTSVTEQFTIAASSLCPSANYRTFASNIAPVRIKPTPDGQGFFLLSADGEVHGYGDAVALGNARLPHPAVSLAVTKTGHGYWVFDTNGCSQAFGDAVQFTQSICATHLNGPVLDAATTPDGGGYWLVASDGGMFTFGDAPFRGSTGGSRLNAPVVGMASSTSGQGYWEVASDGGIFAFNVPFLGSTGSMHLNRPVVGMVASGSGYLMVGSDGGIFNFGNPFFGSLGANPPPAPVVATAPSLDPSGNPNGYWMIDSTGNVYAFGAPWLPA